MRIGHGYDVHRFGEGDHIVLGGVRIPFTQGLVAHSDGDVLIHALCDALLGACALGDIGKHFPDTDPAFTNIDSRELLAQVHRKIQQPGFLIANIDITVVAQVPKIAPYTEAMADNLAVDLKLEKTQVNIKATTTEGLGFVGKQEGIAVYAVVLLDEV